MASRVLGLVHQLVHCMIISDGPSVIAMVLLICLSLPPSLSLPLIRAVRNVIHGATRACHASFQSVAQCSLPSGPQGAECRQSWQQHTRRHWRSVSCVHSAGGRFADQAKHCTALRQGVSCTARLGYQQTAARFARLIQVVVQNALRLQLRHHSFPAIR